MIDSQSFAQLVRRGRSYRRFNETEVVDVAILRDLVDLARVTPSAANLQPLAYVLITDAETRARVFPCLKWAGRLKDWGGPAPGERPSAYIVVLGDTQIAGEINCDHGIAAQTILLGALTRGLGGCMMTGMDREALREVLDLSDRYRILMVLCIGKPAEQVVLEPLGGDGDVAYWRDAENVHHVPKRALEDIIVPPGA
ncbi:MAG: nitroreductase family protein [Thermoleophilia bacterium]|nr:nitroreductase family protein [Thermoleophilia bacterium]